MKHEACKKFSIQGLEGVSSFATISHVFPIFLES